MKKSILWLAIGLAGGFLGGWLLTWLIAVNAIEGKLRDQAAQLQNAEERVSKLRSNYNALLAEGQTQRTQFEKELSEKEVELAKLREENEKLAREFDAYRQEHPERVKESAGEAAQAPASEGAKKEKDAQEPDSESPTAEDIKKIMELREKITKNITPIGGPLNPLAIKELGLDENQVAGINAVLEDEGERMLKRLVEWAGEIVEDKTAEDFAGKSGLEISVAITPYVQADIKKLQKLSSQDQIAISLGRKHFVQFLPKDANLVRITRAFYEERQRTYSELAAYASEEQEKVIKKKYLASGTFIFPGGAGYGFGELKPEDFEE